MTKATKKFFVGFMLCFLSMVSVASFVSAFTACASFDKHSAAVDLVISQATMRYIDDAVPADRVARAQRVIAVVSEVEKLASGDQVSITQLASLAFAAVPDNLPAADRALAFSIIKIAAQELTNRVGNGLLKPEQLVSVHQVLTSVRNAASIYTGS